MNATDTALLRRRLLQAMAAFPVCSAALIGCTDVDYSGNGGVDGAPNNAVNNAPTNPDPNNTPTNPDPNNTNPDPPPTIPPTDPNCAARDDGELDIEYEDFCGAYGQWSMPEASAQELGSNELCFSYSEDELTQGCPTFLYLRPSDVGAEGYRYEAIGLRFVDRDGDQCVYDWFYDNGECVEEGRALSDGEASVVAPLRRGERWSAAFETPRWLESVPQALRDMLGAQWLWSARYEHASIASFSRATLELMAHGAPPELLVGTQQAGIDEVRHAQECFALASAYLGHKVEPAALQSPPVRHSSLAELAVETFIEGVVGESIATLVSTRALAVCRVPQVRRVLEMIIEDESGHAALAWATVAWAIEQGGQEVVDALLEAAAELRTASDVEPSVVLPATLKAELHAHGRLTPAEQRQARQDAWSGVIDPMLQTLVASSQVM